MKDGYKKISRVYNLLSSLYSLGAVDRCRGFGLMEVRAGMRVCFLGVGQGVEAVRAVEMGADVTVVDSSGSMLEELGARLAKLDESELRDKVEVYHGDVMDFFSESVGGYDLVVSHFFLNVFPEDVMVDVLRGMTELCGEGGQVVIGDFWRDGSAGSVVRLVQGVNWSVALFIFRILANNPKHEVYVYDGELEELGFEVVREKGFNVLGIPMYRSILGRLR